MQIRQAILCKYLGPTNHLGTRIVVKTAGRRWVFNMDYELDHAKNAEKFALIVANELSWLQRDGMFIGGTLPNGDYVFICT